MYARCGMVLLVAGGLVLAGCGPAFYTEQADRAVYRIVATKQSEALGVAPQPFTIAPNRIREERFVEAMEAPFMEGPPAKAEGIPLTPLPAPAEGTTVLTLPEALQLAVLANRDYQGQKEQVYLTALTLTFQRYLFEPHPFTTGRVDLNDDRRDNIRDWDGTSDVGFSQQLADGAAIVANLGLTALKFINKELGDTVDSTLDFSLTQPLWRGAGRRVVQENLVQAERNALYAVRTFARYEKTFAVDVANEYLRVLGQRQVVLNEWANYQSLILSRERAEALAQAERLPEFQVDQARQDELRAYNSWINARSSYLNALDEFKLVLGVPTLAPIALDPAELDRLASQGLAEPPMTVDEGVRTALGRRLDLMNVRDGVADAERKIVVAEDELKGDVDLVASMGYTSNPAKPQSARLQLARGDYSIGLDIDLPVDRLAERNALRETQIDLDAAERSLTLQEDRVALQVIEAYRGLERARQSYEIQRRSVTLAERRVESTQLLLQAGRANQRDVLEAQAALVEAQNALTSALVGHTIAALELQRDVGTLVVDEEGQIHGWSLTTRLDG